MDRFFRYFHGRYGTGTKNLSQIRKAIRQQAPITTMAMICPLLHLLPEDDARLNGRRIRAKPAVVKTIPRTNRAIRIWPENGN